MLSPDGRLLFLTCAVRSFAAGGLSVVLGLYLAALGLDPALIGGLIAVALAGSAAMTLVFSSVADRRGRRRLLVVAAALMALAGAVFAISGNVVLLALVAIIGTINPSSRDVGPLPSIEQAILPQTTEQARRTDVFAFYNLVRSLAGALGALAAGLPTVLGLAPIDGYRLLIWGYAAAGLVLIALFARLSPAVEAPAAERATRSRFGIHRSRGIVARLAALFALDSFAGGLVLESLVAYWFSLRYGVDAAALGGIFFGTSLLSAVSQLAAAPISRRIGLLNTMVFTHLPSNVLLALVPLMPNLGLSIAMLLARHLLSQMDVPTRQSYTMAIVEPDERSAAAGLTLVARNAAVSIAPVFAGATLALPALGLPFLLAGGLKIVYDLAILATFRTVRPPEEVR